jgi:hypothetical protein
MMRTLKKYTSPNSPIIRAIISKKMRWAEHVAHDKIMGNFSRKLLRALGIPWHRWEYYTKMDLKFFYVRVWPGFSWTRMGFSGGLLRTR